MSLSPKAIRASLVKDSAKLYISGTGAEYVEWKARASNDRIYLANSWGVGPGRIRWKYRLTGVASGVYLDTIYVKAPTGSTYLVDTIVITGPIKDTTTTDTTVTDTTATDTTGTNPPPDTTSTALRLTVSPKSYSAFAYAGGTDPGDALGEVVLDGTGASSATWKATNKKSWLTLSTATGGGGKTVIKWKHSVSGLAAGRYIDTITVSASGATGSPTRIIDTLTISSSSGTGTAVSPTGRNPRLIWTPHRQWVWNKMKAENHPWWEMIKSNADKSGTSSAIYGDRGQWAMLVYQITGDRTYARKAWAQVQTNWLPNNANTVREHFAETVMIYDWIYPALSTTERQLFIETLNLWGQFALGINTGQYVGGIRTSDSDQCTGAYFGLAFLDLATGPENPTAGTWLKNKDAGSGTPVGGLTATGIDRTTVRNTIANYVSLAEGGEWIESAQYNPGTAVLLIMGAEGVKTATGKDYFPEVTRLLRQMAVTYPSGITPDLEQRVQWGDDEHPRDFQGRLFKHMNLLTALAGATAGTAEGAAAQGMVNALVSKYGASGYGSAEPQSRGLYLFDPYQPSSDWRSLPAARLSAGVGMLTVKNGGSLFMSHGAIRLGVDHQTNAMGTFHLYRNGEWAITHPIGYGSTAVGAHAANTMLLAGLNAAMYSRTILQANQGANWGSITYKTAGSLYRQDYYAPPPSFVQNWTRSLVYFNEGGSDVVVVWDTVVADDPEALGDFDRYRPEDQALIKASPSVTQWMIHTPVSPTVGTDRLSWTTPGGQKVTVYTLKPSGQVRTVIDEKSLWSSSNNFENSEKKYQVRIRPGNTSRVQVYLNVLVVGSTTLTPTLVSGGVQVGSKTVKFSATGVTVQ